MKRGEVWWASLAPGRRPVLIVQSNLFNASRIGTVVVALVTSNLVLEGAPGNVRLRQGEGGVPRAGVVNVSQLFAVERGRLSERLGVLPVPVQQRVDAGLRLVLGLANESGVMEAAAQYAVEDAQAYVGAWRRTAALLDEGRLGNLRALGEVEAAQHFARLLRMPLPYPLRPGSGLVEQQRIFSRLRNTPR